MKSEHRHELAENDLSKVLARWIQRLDEQQNTILSVAVVLALIAAAMIYWTRTSRNERANGWAQLTASSTPEDFITIAESYPGDTIGDWARLRAGDLSLQEGVRLSISDRPASVTRLEQARESYAALTGAGKLPAIREQAMNGLAVTLEALSNGDTEPAITAYEELLTAFPNSRFKKWADDRIAVLKTGSTQDFYTWFHSQNPQPADMPLPQDRSNGSSPLDSLLPDLGAGDLKFSDEPFEPPMADDSEIPADGPDTNPFAPDASADDTSDNAAPAEGAPPSDTPAVETPTSDAPTEEGQPAPTDGNSSSSDETPPANE